VVVKARVVHHVLNAITTSGGDQRQHRGGLGIGISVSARKM